MGRLWAISTHLAIKIRISIAHVPHAVGSQKISPTAQKLRPKIANVNSRTFLIEPRTRPHHAYRTKTKRVKPLQRTLYGTCLLGKRRSVTKRFLHNPPSTLQARERYTTPRVASHQNFLIAMPRTRHITKEYPDAGALLPNCCFRQTFSQPAGI